MNFNCNILRSHLLINKPLNLVLSLNQLGLEALPLVYEPGVLTQADCSKVQWPSMEIILEYGPGVVSDVN